MTSYRRNILVGAIVLLAGTVFIWMILEFSTKTAQVFAPPQEVIFFRCARADGISDGSAVFYLGVTVGRVTSVKRTDDGNQVIIAALIDRNPPIPGNVDATIAQTNPIGGGASLNLELIGAAPQGELPANTTIITRYVGLQMNLIPPEISQTAGQIGAMSEQARKTMEELQKSNVIPDLDNTIKQIGSQLGKVGDTLTSVQSLLDDPKVIENVKVSVANIRAASDKLNTLVDSVQQNSKDLGTAMADTKQHVDDLSKLLGDRLIQLSATMDNIQSITDKLNKGNGSAGAMINDPKLYQSLVDSARELDATATDLHRLIDQWEQEGVSLHLK